MKKWIVVLIGIVLFLVVAVMGFYYYLKTHPELFMPQY